jgi:FHS family L-fucose permease-like MFS transporter
MSNGQPQPDVRVAFASVTILFFAWGLITSLVDPLVAAVKGIFQLSDVEAQLSASAFFIAYGVMSFPAAALSSRLKAGATIVCALLMMAFGCLVMLVAANIETYGLVLAGLFVLASGITLLQVAANPLAAALGPPDRSHFRLTLSQTFNSLGTFIGPYLGATLFLKGVEVKHGHVLTPEVRRAALGGIDSAFFWIGGLILLLLAFMWVSRKRVEAAMAGREASRHSRGLSATIRDAFSSRWAVLGAGAIFLYVGAEVAIGTQMALLLNHDNILGLPLESAGKMVSLYWGGAMLGRLIGTALLTRVKAPVMLCANAGVACLLCIYVVMVGGPAAGYAALAIGLFNSIMFPVIFTVTLERSTASSEATSGLLCFAIIGGAAIPPLTGLVSQASSYSTALLVPATCYALLLLFALAAGRAAPRQADVSPRDVAH